MLGRFGRRRLQGRDLQGRAGDANIGQEAPTGAAIDLPQALIEQGSALLQVDRSVAGDRDRQRPRDLHRGEQGLGDQLVFHGPVLSASDHPDVAGPQPVAQFGEQAEFVSGDIDAIVAKHRRPPAAAYKADRHVLGQCPS